MSKKSDAAVLAVIGRIAADPRVAHYLSPGTRTYELLTEAAAELSGLAVSGYRAALEAGLRYEAPPKCNECDR